MLSFINGKFSLTQLKIFVIGHKLIIVAVAGSAVVLLTVMLIKFVPKQPAKGPVFTSTIGSPKITAGAKITFPDQPITFPDQPTTITLVHQPDILVDAELQNLPRQFSFEPKPTRAADNIKVWTNKTGSLQVNLASRQVSYRKNIYADPKLLAETVIGNQDKISAAASQFIKKQLNQISLLDLASHNIDYFVSKNGVDFTHTTNDKANVAIVTYYYQTSDRSRLITAGGNMLSVTVKLTSNGTVIAADFYLGDFSIQTVGQKQNITSDKIISRLQNQPTVIRAINPLDNSEAITPKYADLKEITVKTVYSAYYFEKFQNLPQNGSLVVVGAGQATTIDNKPLEILIAAAL